MYEAFYNLTEKPFTLLPDPAFLYPSRKHQMALTMLEYGLNDHAGFTVISGEIGAGKTTLIRYLLNNMEHEYTVGLISNTHRSFGELLQWILLAFNLEHKDMDKVEMYQRFVDFIIDEYAHNRRTVLIVDEAQNMEAETLEELRMLSNVNADKDQALQVILVGQRELRETLKRPDLMQFAQRITVDYHLEPLSLEETSGYIRHRLKIAGGDPETFTAAACEAVHRYSNGVPRLINLLCDTALVYGYAEQQARIGAELVTDVAREKQQGGIFPIYAVAPRAGETPAAAPAAAGTANADLAPAAATPPADEPAAATPDSIPAEAPFEPARVAVTPEASPGDPGLTVYGEKKKLNVAVCSAHDDLRAYLSRLLENYGFDVVASIPIEARQLAGLDETRVDVLLIDRDTAHPLPQDAATLIALSHRPVLYNDATLTYKSLRDGNPDFGLQLTERILSLLNHPGAGLAAVR